MHDLAISGCTHLGATAARAARGDDLSGRDALARAGVPTICKRSLASGRHRPTETVGPPPTLTEPTVSILPNPSQPHSLAYPPVQTSGTDKKCDCASDQSRALQQVRNPLASPRETPPRHQKRMPQLLTQCSTPQSDRMKNLHASIPSLWHAAKRTSRGPPWCHAETSRANVAAWMNPLPFSAGRRLRQTSTHAFQS